MNPLHQHFDRSRFFRSIDLRTNELRVELRPAKNWATPRSLAASGWVGMGGAGPGAVAGWAGPARAVSPAVFSFARTLILYRRRRRLGRSGSAGAVCRSSSSSFLPFARMQPRCKKRGRWHADVSRGKEAEELRSHDESQGLLQSALARNL